MNVNINTSVFAVHHFSSTNAVDLTQDFDELDKVLTRVMKVWQDTMDRHHAVPMSDKLEAGQLARAAELLMILCDSAMKNHDRLYYEEDS